MIHLMFATWFPGAETGALFGEVWVLWWDWRHQETVGAIVGLAGWT